MKIIGVTGGVGSGKSEILHYMETAYNCRVVLADEVARDLEMPGGAVYDRLIALLEEYASPETETGAPQAEEVRQPAPITLPDGRINNPEMARRIFSSPSLLQKVNGLVHPAVMDFILEEIRKEREAGRIDYFVLEAALLIEAGYGEIVDELWYIYCSEEERRRRLKASRGYSDEKIDNILKSQLSEASFREQADVVIDNSGALEEARREVDAALKQLESACATT